MMLALCPDHSVLPSFLLVRFSLVMEKEAGFQLIKGEELETIIKDLEILEIRHKETLDRLDGEHE